jgi:monovalent cation/hydrogen antiporter
VGWTGMRGVVCLAAALAPPAVLPDGSAFPHRNLIVFLAFSVICVTLVLQGITLPPLIRALGLARVETPNREEQEAWRVMMEAVVAHLTEAKEKDTKEAAPLYDELTRRYLQRLATVQPGKSRADAADHGRFLQLFLEALHVERETAVRLRNESRIDEEVLRRIEHELDLTESRLMSVT